MACFVVGGAEAAVVTGVRAAVKKSEVEKGIVDEQGNQLTDPSEQGFCMTKKLGWLQTMLAGGAFLLLIEHVWHGEVVPCFPFFTAVSSGDVAGMLHEMATVGVGMAALVTAVWAVGCMVADAVARRAAAPQLNGAVA